MVYVAGIFGFLAGFLAGQYFLLRLLKNYSNDEILNDPSIKWKFGTLNWIIAIAGGYLAVTFYNYFLA